MYLSEPATPEAAAYLEQERASMGYLMNFERAWAWRPDAADAFVGTRKRLMDGSTLVLREFAVLVCATARALGDSYCALAWGARLAKLSDPMIAAEVLRGVEPASLTARERALRRWAEHVVKAPNDTQPGDVEALRAAGFSDKEVFEATLFISLRLAFSTVNDALGARPDAELVASVPPQVREAVTFGRPPLA